MTAVPSHFAGIRALGKVFAWHLLGSTVLRLATYALYAVPVLEWLTYFVWRHGPFASLPFPYASRDLPGFELTLDPWVLPVVTLIAVGTLLFQTVCFHATWLAYRWWGWPRYMADVTPHLQVPSIWAASARASWWVLPVTGLLSECLSTVMYAQYAGFASTIWVVYEDTAWALAGKGLLYAGLSAIVIRRSVARAVTAETLRCHLCGYLRRGLPSDTCPECGVTSPRVLPPPYALGRFVGSWRRVFRPVAILLVLLLLLHPVWISALIRQIPPMRLLLPSAARGMRGTMGSSPYAYPLSRQGAYWVAQGGAGAVLVLRDEGSRMRYELAWWKDADDAGRRPADTVESGRLRTDFPIGPWNAYNQFGPSGPIMFHPLFRDASFRIQAATSEQIAALRAELEKRREDHE